MTLDVGCGTGWLVLELDGSSATPPALTVTKPASLPPVPTAS